MLEAAGGTIQSLESNSSIEPYILGDMTSTVYPVGGAMEDWGYAGGWDRSGSDAGFDKCRPQTLPELADSFFESQENVRCAVYLIETDDAKNPSEATYGAREIIGHTDIDDFQVLRTSIED